MGREIQNYSDLTKVRQPVSGRAGIEYRSPDSWSCVLAAQQHCFLKTMNVQANTAGFIGWLYLEAPGLTHLDGWGAARGDVAVLEWFDILVVPKLWIEQEPSCLRRNLMVTSLSSPHSLQQSRDWSSGHKEWMTLCFLKANKAGSEDIQPHVGWVASGPSCFPAS